MRVQIKQCSRCHQSKPVREFGKRERLLGGYRSACKDCERPYNRQYNQSAVGREVQRRSKLKATYGITPEQYAALLKKQGGRCALCKRRPGQRKLAVDHDHISGKVRGLLCIGCNTGLGALQDDPTLIRLGAKYVESHRG
jgi:hypothetical protein